MTDSLRHRGPDSDGIWTEPGQSLAFGHRRLAVVDLSEHGHQPMASPSGRYVLTFNGEIYNHLDLRAALGDAIRWRGGSDTESLLAGFERWGIAGTLERSVGMFAMAVWDRESKRLTLARDRLGEKPLYLARFDGRLAFASELKALTRIHGQALEIDDAAVRAYFALGFVPQTRSIYRGVEKLVPGTLLTLDSVGAQARVQRYWPAASAGGFGDSEDADDADGLERLERLLQAAVRGQMVSDVPLGAFLSGGIDSSLIVALMQQTASRPIRSFAMGFGDAKRDELRYAAAVALHLGTQHTELRVSPSDVLAAVPLMATVYDEPFADSSQIPTYLLSHLTREHVTVALSGDGGDELFGGYNRYVAADRVERLRNHLAAPLRRGIGAALAALPSDAVERLASVAAWAGRRPAIPALGEKVHRLGALLAADGASAAYLATLAPSLQGRGARDLDLLSNLPVVGHNWPEQMMGWDLSLYLPDDVLVKVDRAAMACSLETRAPFLDHRVVEFARSRPWAWKHRDGRSKWPLRALLARHVPRALFERPKQGFTLPLGDWLRGPLQDWAESLLPDSSSNQTPWLDTGRIRRVWQAHLEGRANHQRELWTALMFLAWMEHQRGQSGSPAPANRARRTAEV